MNMEKVTTLGLDAASWLSNGFRAMFYLIHPEDLALDTNDKPPDYFMRYGIPMFFVMIFLENIALALRKRSHQADYPKTGGRTVDKYRLNDAISCVALGAFQNIFVILLDLLGLTIARTAYANAYEYRLLEVDVKQNPYLSYFFLMLGKDLGYYWAHRFFHEFHLPWTAHSVHHSGEDYNLGTGLRQGALQPLFGWIFYVPIALCGFNPIAFEAHYQLNTLYMYWIHTDLVDRMPFPLEYIMNGPMAHRMHHRPPGNCNYAGVFIVWDRMFGTYQPELVRKDHYGLAKQPEAFNAADLNVNHFSNMANIGGGKSWLQRLFARRVKAKWVCSLTALFEPIPPLKADIRDRGPVRKKWNGEQELSTMSKIYLSAIMLLSVVVFLAFVATISTRAATQSVVLAGSLLAQLIAIGKIADYRSSEATTAFLAPAVLTPFMTYLLMA